MAPDYQKYAFTNTETQTSLYEVWATAQEITDANKNLENRGFFARFLPCLVTSPTKPS